MSKSATEKREDITKNEEIMRDMNRVFRFAEELYDFCKNEEFLKTYDPMQRLSIVQKRYADFYKAYPVVVSYMVQALQYKKSAFLKFFKKMKTLSTTGIEKFIEGQAWYAKYLYMDSVKHYSPREASRIYQEVYGNLYKQYQDIQKAEKEIKSEFEIEKKVHLKQRRQELKKFVLENNARTAVTEDEENEIKELLSQLKGEMEDTSVEKAKRDVQKKKLPEKEVYQPKTKEEIEQSWIKVIMDEQEKRYGYKKRRPAGARKKKKKKGGRGKGSNKRR